MQKTNNKSKEVRNWVQKKLRNNSSKYDCQGGDIQLLQEAVREFPNENEMDLEGVVFQIFEDWGYP